MRITVSQARGCLGQLCAQAQEPRQPIVLTRHGRDIAALVSMEEAGRIWQMQQQEWNPRNPFSGRARGASLVLPQGMTTAADGKIVTRREAAEQVRRLQMSRADERRMLAEGGLSPVDDGELAVTCDVPASEPFATVDDEAQPWWAKVGALVTRWVEWFRGWAVRPGRRGDIRNVDR